MGVTTVSAPSVGHVYRGQYGSLRFLAGSPGRCGPHRHHLHQARHRRGPPFLHSMGSATSTPTAVDLQSAIKVIVDLDDLVRLVLDRLPRIKTWQRHLASHLATAQREIQVLRMTIALGRPANELIEAALALRSTVRAIDAGLRATRADAGTRQALRLITRMGESIAQMLSTLAEEHPGTSEP